VAPVTAVTEGVRLYADGTNQTAHTTLSSRSLSWSPDGTKIIFASESDGDFDIYTIDADGSDVAQITANPEVKDMDPDWQSLSPKSTFQNLKCNKYQR
jgi:Tol biopolymer transport system component